MKFEPFTNYNWIECHPDDLCNCQDWLYKWCVDNDIRYIITKDDNLYVDRDGKIFHLFDGYGELYTWLNLGGDEEELSKERLEVIREEIKRRTIHDHPELTNRF